MPRLKNGRAVEPPSIPADLAAWLLDARASLGLTQAQMAAALGIPKNTWSNWEQGRYLPKLPAVLVMAIQWLQYRQRAAY